MGSSGLSGARIEEPAWGVRAAGGSHLERGSKGARLLRAWALFRSGGGGGGWKGRRVPRPAGPPAVLSGAGSLPSLGLQWRPSSAPGTPQPRPRLLLPAQQLRPPRPFSPRTPAAGQAAHAQTPPARQLSQQKPFPPGPQCACDSARGWAGWGAFSPAGLIQPPPRARPPPPRPPPQAPAFTPCSAVPLIHHLPSIPPTPLLHSASQPCPPRASPLSSASVVWGTLSPSSPA